MAVGLNKQSLERWQREDLEHLRYEYDLNRDDVVFDVGAYRGEFATEIRRRYGCQLVVIEPTDAVFQLKAVTGVRIVNRAAAAFDGVEHFGGQYYYTSSFEEPTHTYRCVDINRLLSEYERVALLKMNIEGAEYDLLQHIIAAGRHRVIDNLQVQFHEIEGLPFERWYEELATQLKESHELTFRYAYCWENWRLRHA